MNLYAALVALVLSLAMVVAGLVWLFGPYGLIGSGLACAVLTLFVFDVRGEERRAEPVVHPAQTVIRR